MPVYPGALRFADHSGVKTGFQEKFLQFHRFGSPLIVHSGRFSTNPGLSVPVLARNLLCQLPPAVAALDAAQDEKLSRVVGDPDELLAARKGAAKLVDC